MQLLRRLLLLFLLALAAAHTCRAHNITKILASHPSLSTFNHYLTLTHLAGEINRRLTITVLALDNEAMSNLLSQHLTIYTIKNVLSLHILADYFGAKKLHQITHRTALVASLFQATGAAPDTTGFVNITNLKGGRVGFGAEDNNGVLDASFVKSVKEIPYNISVVQISKMLKSPEAEAPSASPAQLDIKALMSKKSCKTFADLVSSTASVEKAFQSALDTGLTIFCPVDAVINKFMHNYTSLNPKSKASLLLAHALPDYNSMQMLKSATGDVDTLASDTIQKGYGFTVSTQGEAVRVSTSVNSARVTGTVVDEQPLAIYSIDKVLLPGELFKAQVAAVSDGGVAADGPMSDDEVADGNWGGKRGVGWWWLLVALVVVGVFGV